MKGLVLTGPVLIVGAGHAGFQLATSLRQHGFAEPIRLLNDEAHLPYQRPPLSKAYLKGAGGADSLMFRPASGVSLDYGHLVLATGARNRLLDIPNASLEAVRYLRSLDDSETLRQL